MDCQLANRGCVTAYDPTRDYRDYAVRDETDEPLLDRVGSAALLRLSGEQVRKLVLAGRLPARRASGRYNAPYEIPRWAVEGLARHRAGVLGPPPPDPPEQRRGVSRDELERGLDEVRRLVADVAARRGGAGAASTAPVEGSAGQLHAARARVAELEQALLAVRASRERLRRADRLRDAALAETRGAYDDLEEAVTGVVLPRTAEGAE